MPHSSNSFENRILVGQLPHWGHIRLISSLTPFSFCFFCFFFLQQCDLHCLLRRVVSNPRRTTLCHCFSFVSFFARLQFARIRARFDFSGVRWAPIHRDPVDANVSLFFVRLADSCAGWPTVGCVCVYMLGATKLHIFSTSFTVPAFCCTFFDRVFKTYSPGGLGLTLPDSSKQIS